MNQELSAEQMDKEVVQVRWWLGEETRLSLPSPPPPSTRWRCPVDGRWVDKNAGWRMGNEQVCVNCYHWYLDKLKELPEFWKRRAGQS